MSKHQKKAAKGDCCKEFAKCCPNGDCCPPKGATPPAPAKPANDEKCPAKPVKPAKKGGGGGCCPGGGGGGCG